MNDAAPAIAVDGLSKRFDATVALDDVSFSIPQGEIRALIGENGAGKSTLVKILSGLVREDSGFISVFGENAAIGRPARAHAFGIQTAFQEMTLIDDMTVTQNMLLPYEPLVAGQIDRRGSKRAVVQHFARLGLDDVDPNALVGDLVLSTRQKIEIAKAVAREPRVLLLDEPTSTLSAADVGWLGDLIESLNAAGVTIVFISHRMAEVRRFCRSLTVLRNGHHVGSYAIDEVSDDEVVRLVIGRSLGAIYPEREDYRLADAPTPALAGTSLAITGTLDDLSFQLWPGEVLGIGALQGMGQRELFEALFGERGLDGGTIALAGRPLTLTSPADAVRAGISMVPEDRKTEALFLRLSGAANASIPIIDRFATAGWIDRKAEAAAVDEVLRPAGAPTFYKTVQDRLLLLWRQPGRSRSPSGCWRGARSLAFDPTRGVDIGTKREIYVLIRALAKAGVAILYYSTEIPELVNICDRVLVMYRGHMVKELVGDEITEQAIMGYALGAERDADGAETAAAAPAGAAS